MTTGDVLDHAHAAQRDYEFWRSHGAWLVWSNLNASDSVMIMHALLKPNFHLLLAIAARFGLRRLKTEWEELKSDTETLALPEEIRALEYAKPTVERCLKHMEMALHR